MVPRSYWELKIDVNGYKNLKGSQLSTQAIAGRKFEVIENKNTKKSRDHPLRVKVRLLEDGYICWFDLKEIDDHVFSIKSWSPTLLKKEDIKNKLPKVLRWVEKASEKRNCYLWGGTSGPNFDCSGLIQTAFASEGIWLPRDSYQQELFCKKINFNETTFEELIPGDLIFFGNNKKCSHVGLYKGNKVYWHSSGKENGRNGIGIDELQPTNKSKISIFYRSILRSIGRVENCHNGSTLL